LGSEHQTGHHHRSTRWVEILGYAESDLHSSAKVYEVLVHPDDLDLAWRAVGDHLETGALYDAQYRMRHKTGDYVWIRARGQAVWDDDGAPIWIAGSIQDITDIKLANARNDQAFGAIKHMSYAISIYGPDDRLVYLNQAMKKPMPGYGRRPPAGHWVRRTPSSFIRKGGADIRR